jgi:hypothetical protein
LNEKENVSGGHRKLHSEELQNLYSLSDIRRVIKLRLMGENEKCENIGRKVSKEETTWSLETLV